MPLRKMIEQQRKKRFGARAIGVSGAMAALLVIASFVAFAAYERQERLAEECRRVELLAQQAASQASSLLEAAHLLPDPQARAEMAQKLAQVVIDPSDEVVLARSSGEVLAATAGGAVRPGQTDVALRALLAGQEDGVASAQGKGAASRIVAVRALPSHRLFVVVARPQAAAFAEWRDSMQVFALMATLAAGLILLATYLCVRYFLSREAVRGKLDAALLALATHGSELATLVASVQELIFRTDAEGRISFLNEPWQHATGLALEALMGRRFASVMADHSRADVDALFEPMHGGDARRRQLQLRAAEGQMRRLNVAVVPLRTDGVVVGFAGSAVDVTEQFEAERRLKEQLAYNQLLVEVNPLPTSLVDAYSRILTVNHAWEAFRGCRKEEVVGLPVSDFLPQEQGPRVRAQNMAVLRDGGPLRYETTVLAGDGSKRDMVLTKVAVVDAAHGLAVLTVAMDVSEFRDAERATRHARDLAEQASRAKSEFVANISHELRTPLQSILGFSELGVVRSVGQPRLNEMFTGVHEAGKRMLALVNDLLDVSKIESSVGTMHLERGDLREWVEAVTEELQPLLDQRRLRLDRALGSLPLVAKADPLRLQQVVRNLLANAIKFSPVGAAIELSGGYTPEGGIELAVRDHGPGIPPGELEAIFEAFVQSSQTADGSGGTGLGLAISRKIMQAHGGRIWAENAADGGSLFRLVMPAARGFADTTT